MFGAVATSRILEVVDGEKPADSKVMDNLIHNDYIAPHGKTETV
jgi:hypothetical protein